jgi:ABC-type lipoprotein release transport system permease subunit
VTFVAFPAVVVSATLAACALPARRAAQVDAVTVMKD